MFSTNDTRVDEPLFRPEFSTFHSQIRLGTIRLLQPISNWLIVLVAVFVSSALIAFVCLGSVTSKARISGVTVPAGGNISVLSPNAAVVSRVLVAEGQAVVAGQALFELSTARHGDQGELSVLVGQQLAQRKHALEAEQRAVKTAYSEKKRTIRAKIINLKMESEQIDQEIALMERRGNLAHDSFSKYQSLERSGYVSAQQVQQKQEDVIDAATRLSTLRRTRLQLEANILSALSEQKVLESGLSADLAQSLVTIAEVEQEILQNRSSSSSLVTAPQGGVVSAINFPEGQAVVNGQSLATLVPNSGPQSLLEAHLYSPSRSAGFVQAGQTVLLRLQAYPYQKFGLQRGVVIEVSKVPFTLNELPAVIAGSVITTVRQNTSDAYTGEPMFRIKVRLARQAVSAYGRDQVLRPGMVLEADVIRDRRKIWEWLAEPILAVTQ